MFVPSCCCAALSIVPWVGLSLCLCSGFKERITYFHAAEDLVVTPVGLRLISNKGFDLRTLKHDR